MFDYRKSAFVALALSSNLLIPGLGDNRVHILCRSSSQAGSQAAAQGICAELAQAPSNAENPPSVVNVSGEPAELRVLAGNGWPVNSGDGGPATSAALYQPSASVADSQGNIIVAIPTFHTIRVVCRKAAGVCSGLTDGIRLYAPGQPGGTQAIVEGHIYHLAGVWSDRSTNPNYGYGHGPGCAGEGDGVAANDSCLSEPHAVAIDSHDNVLIADTNNGRVRLVCLNHLADDPYCSDAAPGQIVTVDSKLLAPTSAAFDSFDNVAVGDRANFRVRVICAGDFGLCRGRGAREAFTATSRLNSVGGVAFDSANNLLISDPESASVSVVCGAEMGATCQQLGSRARPYRLNRVLGLEPLTITDRDNNVIRLNFF